MAITETERYLFPDVKKLLEQPAPIRIRYFKNKKFINYNFKDVVYEELQDLYDQPVDPHMGGLLIYSPTNNGKSTLILKFIEEFAPTIDGKILYIETPERTTLKEFYAEILDVLGYPVITSTRSTGDLRRKILEALRKRNVKMLFIDEIHNLLASNRDSKKDVLNGLRSLNNRALIPIVLIGTELALDILDLDEQVADRYAPFEIPLWEYNDEFRNFLATFEAQLPLKLRSNLHSDRLSKRIYEISEGKIGRVTFIITKCAIKAIRNESERITLDLINGTLFRWTNEKKSYSSNKHTAKKIRKVKPQTDPNSKTNSNRNLNMNTKENDLDLNIETETEYDDSSVGTQQRRKLSGLY